MKHLTDQQFESILAGMETQSDHLAECDLCRNRLSEFRAIQVRLRGAFDSVHADHKLIDRLRSRLNTTNTASSLVISSRTKPILGLHKLLLPLAAAAAALLLIAVPLTIHLATPEAGAAQAELFQIHQKSLSPHTELYADADPAKLAEYLKDQLGFQPAFPRLGSGMSLRGCCVAHFRNQPVGSYVVQTPQGIISLIVIRTESESLGLKTTLQRGRYTYKTGSFARCNMVTSELGGYTYCAVGEVPHAFLAELLDQLVPHSPQ